jgi:cyclophilin family peptidyl-prolyl cis-trans isomerase|eukprot:Transcript_25071.p1 GENE.Transcript_25071~~Transcript_25071.p1  ORF type:complete len:246 (-),score=89.73 Transcript_25071:191-928(-)
MREACARGMRLMLTSLLATSFACDDEHPNCVGWASSGECKNNPGFMKASCPKSCDSCPAPLDPRLIELGPDRVVLEIELGGGQTGEVELGFYPNAAPVTVAHILKLFRLRCYDTNHIFRVDKGFVAQVQSVSRSSVTAPLSPECDAEAAKTVPGEFTAVPHKRGILSMGRMSDPNSGGSSFSMLLGAAPHLDNQYTVFGKLLRGDEVLAQLEQVKTKKEGIFVMPLERITIARAYVVGSERAPSR